MTLLKVLCRATGHSLGHFSLIFRVLVLFSWSFFFGLPGFLFIVLTSTAFSGAVDCSLRIWLVIPSRVRSSSCDSGRFTTGPGKIGKTGLNGCILFFFFARVTRGVFLFDLSFVAPFRFDTNIEDQFRKGICLCN